MTNRNVNGNVAKLVLAGEELVESSMDDSMSANLHISTSIFLTAQLLIGIARRFLSSFVCFAIYSRKKKLDLIRSCSDSQVDSRVCTQPADHETVGVESAGRHKDPSPVTRKELCD